MGMDNSQNLQSCQNIKDTRAKLDYLKELLTDRSILAADPRTYLHLESILEKEILRIRSSFFSTFGINAISDNDLPEPEGPKVNLQAKVYMPPDSTNSFNFVGRILGPDGSTAKCLQQCLGVKIMVRGRGSMRDRRKEDSNVGKPNWEHLNDRLHVVLTVEDYENRAKARLAKASEYITLFLKESMKGSDKDDKVKQMQLMELSFRREACQPWHFNGNNMLDLTVSTKPGSLFPTTTNAYGFGFGYPPVPPLFSQIVQNPALPVPPQPPHHHHHHHYGQFGNSGQQQPQQNSINGSGVAAPHQNGLGEFTYPFTSNFNAATIFLGHGPAAANYACQFSPTAHPPQSGAGQISSLPPGLTLNYWSGQGIPNVSTEFQFGSSQLGASQSCVNVNGFRLSDDSMAASSLLSNASSSQASSIVQPVNSNNQSTSAARGFNDDSLSQYVLSDLAACSLGGTKENSGLETCVPPSGKYGASSSSDTHMNKMDTPTNSSPKSVNAASVGGSCNGISKMNAPKHRYSQKHNGHLSGVANQPSTYTNTNTRAGTGRSTVVTVKVGSGGHHSPKQNGTSSSSGTDSNGFATGKKSTKPKSNVGQADKPSGKLSASSVESSGPPASSSEADWPKLGAAVQDRRFVSMSLPKQAVPSSDLV